MVRLFSFSLEVVPIQAIPFYLLLSSLEQGNSNYELLIFSMFIRCYRRDLPEEDQRVVEPVHSAAFAFSTCHLPSQTSRSSQYVPASESPVWLSVCACAILSPVRVECCAARPLCECVLLTAYRLTVQSIVRNRALRSVPAFLKIRSPQTLDLSKT